MLTISKQAADSFRLQSLKLTASNWTFNQL